MSAIDDNINDTYFKLQVLNSNSLLLQRIYHFTFKIYLSTMGYLIIGMIVKCDKNSQPISDNGLRARLYMGNGEPSHHERILLSFYPPCYGIWQSFLSYICTRILRTKEIDEIIYRLHLT